MNARARITGLLATLTTLVLVAGVPAALVTFAEASSFGNFLAHLPPPMHGQARDVLRRR